MNSIKSKLLKLPAMILPGAMLAALSSCSSTSQGEKTITAATQKGVPGGVFVQTASVTATVTAIDAANRKFTLTRHNGKHNTFKAGPEVVNFPQIQVGDKVTALVTEEVLVYMANEAPPANEGAATLVALAPVGAKPGGLMAEAVQIKAKVTAIDLKDHRATLEFPDGSTHKVAVREDVDLTQRKVGEEVVIRSTESVAITINKP
jgi:hypothetical protein